MCPFFINKEVPEEAVVEAIMEYLTNGKKLLGTLSAEKVLLYGPLLKWYVDHGAVVKAVYHRIDYQLRKIFTSFPEQVTAAWWTGRCVQAA